MKVSREDLIDPRYTSSGATYARSTGDALLGELGELNVPDRGGLPDRLEKDPALHDEVLSLVRDLRAHNLCPEVRQTLLQSSEFKKYGNYTDGVRTPLAEPEILTTFARQMTDQTLIALDNPTALQQGAYGTCAMTSEERSYAQSHPLSYVKALHDWLVTGTAHFPGGAVAVNPGSLASPLQTLASLPGFNEGWSESRHIEHQDLRLWPSRIFTSSMMSQGASRYVPELDLTVTPLTTDKIDVDTINDDNYDQLPRGTLDPAVDLAGFLLARTAPITAKNPRPRLIGIPDKSGQTVPCLIQGGMMPGAMANAAGVLYGTSFGHLPVPAGYDAQPVLDSMLARQREQRARGRDLPILLGVDNHAVELLGHADGEWMVSNPHGWMAGPPHTSAYGVQAVADADLKDTLDRIVAPAEWVLGGDALP